MTYPIVSSGRGVTRKLLAEHLNLMVVAFRFDEGAEGKLHDHMHVQSTFVQSGRFRFQMAGKTYDLGVGDSMIIPYQITHGCLIV